MQINIWQTLCIIVVIIIFATIEIICYSVSNEQDKHVHHNSNRHLIYIDNVLTKYKIKHWLMTGTLLGAVRFKKIIHYDPDIDIGIMYSDVSRLLELNNVIKSDGYYLKKTQTYVQDIVKKQEHLAWDISLKLMYNNNYVGDIMAFSLFSDGIIRRYDRHNNLNYWPSLFTFPAWFIEELSIVEINGRKYNAPRDPETILEYWYGPDWKTYKISEDEYFPNIDVAHRDRHLSFLINHVAKNKIIIVPKKNNARFTFPQNQIEWMNNNDTSV